MTKISQLSDLGDNLAAGDEFVIRDISDVSTPNKKVTASGFASAVANLGLLTLIAAGSGPQSRVQCTSSGSTHEIIFTTSGTERLRINSAGQVASSSLGSVAAPIFTFSGDTNTGIYSPGADQLAVATNGTGRLFIDANGSIGVGTSSPTSYGSGITTGSLNGSAGSITDFYFNGVRQGLVGTFASNEMLIDTAGAAIPLKLLTNSAERARIRADGTFEIKGGGTSGVSPGFSVSPSTPANSFVIDSSGRLLVGTVTQVGNVNGGILQLGSGITFPATAVAASDANTLDDYEEGTWTPTVIGSTTAGTATYVLQNAKYTKTGRTVFVEALLNYTAGNGTGDLFISGLPFTSADSVTTPAIAASIFSGITLTVGHVLTMRVENTNTRIGFYSYPLGGGGYATVAYDGEGVIGFSGSYTV